LLLHAATALAAAVGPNGGSLGVPQPLDSVHAGAPWPPLDALHALLNAMYSRGARFGAEAAPALRSAVTSIRERISAEDSAGGDAGAEAPASAWQQPQQQPQQQRGWEREDEGGDEDYDGDESHADALLYGRRAAGPSARPGVNVRGLLAAGSR